MTEMVKTALAVNAYWFSLPLIGYAIALSISRQSKWLYGKNLAHILLKQHVFTVVVASFGITVGLFSILSFPLYIFHLPVLVPVIAYSALLLASIVYLTIRVASRVFSEKPVDVFSLNGQTLFVKILFFGLCTLLLADLLITVFLSPAFPWGDGVFHMARVMNILGQGFNIQSSFYSNVPEGGYLYNVLYALYSVPAFITHIAPMRIWEYSLGFARLMLWFSIFTLAVQVFKYWIKDSKNWMLFSTLGLITAMSTRSAQLFTANYPSQMVIVWMIFLFICLAFNKRSQIKLAAPIVIALAFLITTTHTTYGLISGCFMAVLFMVRLIVMGKEYVTKLTLVTNAVSIAVMFIGPLIAKFMPVRASQDLIEVAKIDVTHIGGMTMLTPKFPTDFWMWVTVLASYGAIIALIIMLWRRSLKYQATLIGVSVFTFWLLVYIPPVFTILNKLMPTWVILRFNAIDIFSRLSVVFIAYVVYRLILKFAPKDFSKHMSRGTVINLILLVVTVLTLSYSAVSAKASYKALLVDRKSKVDTYNSFDDMSKSFKGVLKNNALVVSFPTQEYYLDALYDIDVLTTEYGHSPITADGKDRDLCNVEILKELRYADLKAIGDNYVVLSPYDVMAKTKMLADKMPYLKIVAKDQYYVVYKFIAENTPSNPGVAYQPCVQYQINESR